VERIVAQRNRRYLVYWLGYPIEDATWQSRADLQGAEDKLAEFHERQQQAGAQEELAPLQLSMLAVAAQATGAGRGPPAKLQMGRRRKHEPLPKRLCSAVPCLHTAATAFGDRAHQCIGACDHDAFWYTDGPIVNEQLCLDCGTVRYREALRELPPRYISRSLTGSPGPNDPPPRHLGTNDPEDEEPLELGMISAGRGASAAPSERRTKLDNSAFYLKVAKQPQRPRRVNQSWLCTSDPCHHTARHPGDPAHECWVPCSLRATYFANSAVGQLCRDCGNARWEDMMGYPPGRLDANRFGNPTAQDVTTPTWGQVPY
jgi:hypothetical protein